MLNNKYLKNSIISFIMTGVVLMPYLGFTSKVYAQNYTAGSGVLQSGSGGNNLQGYMKGLAPAIAKLPGCKEKIKTGINSLFSGGSTGGDPDSVPEISPATEDGGSSEKISSDSLESEASQATEEEMSVKVALPKAINDILSVTKKNTGSTAGSTKSQDEKTSCMNSIGRMVTGILLQKLTMSTVDWINHGFEGKPLFIQNPTSFFTDIAKNEILQFGFEIKNPTLFPFGQAFMENQARAFQNKFAQNAQYSMNDLIRNTTPEYTSETFNADFAAGGWNAWNAMTQVPANNPLGFNKIASEEINIRLAGTAQSKAQDTRDALKEAGGFLGQERCASNQDITRETERQDLTNGNPYSNNPSDPAYKSWNEDHLCQKWEYVTPGKMVAESATKAINYPDNKLLKADDLNDALAAILDAVMNRFATQVLDKSTGFANASTLGADGSSPYSSITGNNGDYSTQVEKDFSSDQTGTAWFKANPNFNIRTDVTQALIDTQRTYVNKLESYDKELNALIRTINQLDYCIPGPRPGWEETARANIDYYVEHTKSEFQPSETDQIAGSLAGTLDPSGLSATAFQLALLKEQKSKLSDYIAGQIKWYTGMPGIGDDETNHRLTKDTFVNFLNGLFSTYQQTINKYYKDGNFMPFVWRESVEKYNKIAGYKLMISNHAREISFQKENITKLQKLKEGIDNGTYTDFSPTSFPVKQFARLAQSLVSGNDIAKTNSLYEQAQDERNYVWNDLLKGPDGCEQELYNTWRANKIYAFASNQRPDYGDSILYKYDMAVDAPLPNAPTIPIPGITFSAVSPYTGIPYNNKQAFFHDQISFLQGIYTAGNSNGNNFPDFWSCYSLGGTCGTGWGIYTPAFESRTLGIY